MRRLAYLIILLAIAMLIFVAAGGALAQTSARHWVGTWAASPQPPYDEGVSQSGFDNQTVRNIVNTSIGGSQLRVRLSNAYGSQPLTFGEAHVGIQSAGAAIVPGSDRKLTFDGRPSVTIPAGEEVYSDPVTLEVAPAQDLAVSLYVPGKSGPTTWHELANQVNYVSNPGNHASDTLDTAFSDAETSYFWVTGVEVVAPAELGAVVTLGDSITDGFNSTLNANGRYPDYLAQRLLDAPTVQKSVPNAGISGNRVLHDAPCCGEEALDRLDRDVFSQAGVTDVVLLEGINDIGFSQLEDPETAPHTAVSADQIIAGMQQIVDRAHAEGLEIHGGTLTPFKGADYYYPEGEAKRQAVNDWIRTSGEFDGVIDFDKAVRDPGNPEQILPRYDSGDHLHPNSVGYQAMASAIDLSLFAGSPHAAAAQMPDTGGPSTAGLLLPVGSSLLGLGVLVLLVRRHNS